MQSCYAGEEDNAHPTTHGPRHIQTALAASANRKDLPMIVLREPMWLLLLFPVVAALFAWPMPSRPLQLFRLLITATILLALCRPAIRLPSNHGTVMVIADRSKSMPPSSDAQAVHTIRRLEKSRHTTDCLGVVAFANQTVVEAPPQVEHFSGFVNKINPNGSDLTAAIDLATALLPPEDNGRILILSDGCWTGKDPLPAAARAAARGLAIDFLPSGRIHVDDIAIDRVSAPQTVDIGQSFLIPVWIRTSGPTTLQCSLTRNARPLANVHRQVSHGLTRLLFRDTAPQRAGILDYRITVTSPHPDPIPENNRARFLVDVRGPRPILCVSRNPNSGLAHLLSASALNLERRQPQQCNWSFAELSNFTAVILEDLPASLIGQAGMNRLAAWVEHAGGGLMLTGGKNAYGPGGYFHSPLDPLLPISMELRTEHRKLSVAIVVALDRSGSMAMPAGGGKRKMDLANLGTVQVLDLLSDMDELGVIAVDSSPHTIVPLSPLSNLRDQRSNILRIQSMGGGIFVYEALVASAKMLSSAQAGTRHIILFADAADAEQPGDYKKLLQKCSQAGITVSVVGLGTPTDPDADFLRDVAARGKGRCFFTADPGEIPRLFAQDTFSVARSTFVTDPTSFRFSPALITLFNQPLPSPPRLGGYNLCYLRPGATLGAVTVDEYKAPVIAAWQSGAGRVLCYTGEADGKYTGPIAAWKHTGDLFSGMARWTAGAENNLPANMAATVDALGALCRVRLYLDPEQNTADSRYLSPLPKLLLLRADPNGRTRTVTKKFHWLTPDLLECSLPLTGSESVLPILKLRHHPPVRLSPLCLPYSPEYRPPPPGHGPDTLRRIAHITGGTERTNPDEIWHDIPRKPRNTPLAPWLFLLALILVLIEVLQRRTAALALLPRLITNTLRRRKPVRPKGATDKAPEEAPPVPRTKHPPDASKPQPKKSADSAKKNDPPDSADVLDAMKKIRKRRHH